MLNRIVFNTAINFFCIQPYTKSACVHVGVNNECLKMTGFLETVEIPVLKQGLLESSPDQNILQLHRYKQKPQRQREQGTVSPCFPSMGLALVVHNPRRITLLFSLGATGM